MKFLFTRVLALTLSLLAAQAQGPTGPFATDKWPGSLSKTKTVHYFSVGDLFAPPSATWTGTLGILSGGDQVTTDIKIGGYDGLKASANYLNILDSENVAWAESEEIDILMQVYGDGALFAADGAPRDFHFLIGALPELDFPVGGQIPVEARNRQWNWVLFRIPNTLRPSDSKRRVGVGGVNGGTIRMEGVPNLIVRVVAFGDKGAFGEPEQVNHFAGATACPGEPETNHAWIDIAKNQNEHMQVANAGDQKVTFADNIGPSGDKRRAVRAAGSYVNFPITDNFLGAACNDPRAVKVCIEFFDDPALAGKTFGPEAYATDSQGGTGLVKDTSRQTLGGTGKWVKRAWTIPAVSLFGLNVAPLTAGPRLFFEDGGAVYISRFDLGIFRIGTNSLSGQDPLPNCFSDPDWCTYGNFAEMDLASGKLDGLSPGSSGGDQEMIQAEAGPAKDRRMAVRPARGDGGGGFNHEYLNFAITDEKLGPSSQPGVKLAICVTYYDDPNLTGASFRPEVYSGDRGGNEGLLFTQSSVAVQLEGTDTWRDAYFEITDVKFTGVNQGPQAAARFIVSDKVFFSRVRYGAIRGCDVSGTNPLAACKPVTEPIIKFVRNTNGSLKFSWAGAVTDFVLEQTSNLSKLDWTGVTLTPVVEDTQVTATVAPTVSTFYRLRKR